MKPEQLSEAFSTYDAYRFQQAELQRLRDEDPGIPPGMESLSPTQRYSQMYEYLRETLRAPLGDLKDHSRGVEPASTPTLPIVTNDLSGSRVHYLRFDLGPAGSSITAVWMESENSRTPEGGRGREFSYEEEVKKADIADNQLNPHLQTKLNQLDWSFQQFVENSSQLTPRAAEELGFPADFIATLAQDS